jgi:hypothetical protein
MPSAIVATAGAANANSYLTRAEADIYFGDRLFASRWTGASNDNKDQALLWATKLIDATIIFTGEKTAASQALEWPRTGMLDRNGDAVSTSTIPQLLKDITAEVALTLLASDRLAESDASVQGLSSLRAGPVTLTFKESIPAPKAVAETIYNMFVFSWIWRAIPGPLIV